MEVVPSIQLFIVLMLTALQFFVIYIVLWLVVLAIGAPIRAFWGVITGLMRNGK